MSQDEVARILANPFAKDACPKLLAWSLQHGIRMYWAVVPAGTDASPEAPRCTVDLFVGGSPQLRASASSNKKARTAVAWRYLEILAANGDTTAHR